MLTGELTLSVYGKSHVIRKDEAVLFTADRPHRYANEGDEEVRFVMVVTEPRDTPDR